MARRRKKSARKAPASRRKARRSRRGLRGFAGLGSPSSPFMQSGVPALVATLVTSGVAIGLRVVLADTMAGSETKANLVKYAPAIGAGAGLAASGAFYALSGAPAAAAAALVSVVNAAFLMASDKVIADKPAVLTAIATTPAAAATISGMRGLGAIVPETNLGAILMERNRGGLIGTGMGATVPSAGEIVDLRGTINPSAFGQ